MNLEPATVTQVSPLRVILDGADVDSLATKITVFTAAVNQRVMVTTMGTSLYVIGPIGG